MRSSDSYAYLSTAHLRKAVEGLAKQSRSRTGSEAILPRQEVREGIENYGEPAGTRTQGPRLKRAMLYRLSYRLTERRGRIVSSTLSLCLDCGQRRTSFW